VGAHQLLTQRFEGRPLCFEIRKVREFVEGDDDERGRSSGLQQTAKLRSRAVRGWGGFSHKGRSFGGKWAMEMVMVMVKKQMAMLQLLMLLELLLL
jgi:hypothetical protein